VSGFAERLTLKRDELMYGIQLKIRLM